jgi:hypothetical protein
MIMGDREALEEQALTLRTLPLSYEQIADRLGLRSRREAHDLVVTATRRRIQAAMRRDRERLPVWLRP